MSHEDADAEQDTCCRNELDHSSPPSEVESSTGSFPDDFVESGNGFVGGPSARCINRRRRSSDETFSRRTSIPSFGWFDAGAGLYFRCNLLIYIAVKST
jgi:hypothetical protein